METGIFMDVDFAELRWRIEAVKKHGYKRDRLFGGYVKFLRYEEFRSQVVLRNTNINGCYRDHEDFLDYVQYREREAVRSMADYISEKAFDQSGYFADE